MSGLNLRRVFLLAGPISLALIYAVLGTRMLSDFAQRTGSDFIAFYAAGRILEQSGPAQVYDLRLQQRAESEVLGVAIQQTDVNPFVHPAFIFPLLQLAIDEDYVASFLRWTVLMLMVLAAGSVILALWAFDPSADASGVPVFLGSLLFFPAFISLANGQDTAILLLGCALWAYGFSKGRDWLSGIGLGLATIRPHLVLALALPFLFNRRRIGWGFFAGASVLAALSVSTLGSEGVENYLRILSVSGAGQDYHIQEAAMINLIGLLARAAPWLPDEWIRWTGWSVYLLAIAGLCWLWARTDVLKEKHIGLAVLVGLLAAPHLHYHDAALLLVPIIGLARVVRDKRQLSSANAALLPLIFSLVLAFSYNDLLKYAGLGLVMAWIGLWLWFSEHTQDYIRQKLGFPSSRPT